MKIIKSPEKVNQLVNRWKRRGESVGFVPTMGALHEGHLALIRRARKENSRVVVSIFVNPAQFGPGEDYRRYPRPFRRDAGWCRQAKVDLLFYPAAEKMYPADYRTEVHLRDWENIWCGRFRPGHFAGVATVVAKLLNIVSPHRAYFGEKDFQQLVIIKKMVADLNFPVEIIAVKTVRESSGLAMSSRNIYLNKAERRAAEKLYPELKKIRADLLTGRLKPTGLPGRLKSRLKQLPEFEKINWKLDYAAVVNNENLSTVKKIAGRGNARILVALWIGSTRLIDNLLV